MPYFLVLPEVDEKTIGCFDDFNEAEKAARQKAIDTKKPVNILKTLWKYEVIEEIPVKRTEVI